ncbi:MAG: transglycosylase family protein [Actinobacteria bacterium]|nr:transglycosylase family protein [Actinomycetota bacterium]
MPGLRSKPRLAPLGVAASLAALLAILILVVPPAGAADRGKLESKLAAAREEAGSIAAGLQQSHAELAGAEAEAQRAENHERRLTELLAEGEAHAAELERKAERTQARLARERARLQRARAALANRLVAIYETGVADPASLVLGSGDFEELVTQADYLRLISEADSSLAARVAQVRNEVKRATVRVEVLHRRAVAYDERLAAAREEISSVRAAAQAAADHLAAVSASRESSLAALKGDIGTWVKQVQQIRAAEARAASAAEAEEEVGRWLGGPYTIPTYIVMCESGGDYGAVNPSSGAGGAYQILPSTWELYGGQGEPQNAPKAEQDRIASEIWADSGPSAWVCG